MHDPGLLVITHIGEKGISRSTVRLEGIDRKPIAVEHPRPGPAAVNRHGPISVRIQRYFRRNTVDRKRIVGTLDPLERLSAIHGVDKLSIFIDSDHRNNGIEFIPERNLHLLSITQRQDITDNRTRVIQLLLKIGDQNLFVEKGGYGHCIVIHNLNQILQSCETFVLIVDPVPEVIHLRAACQQQKQHRKYSCSFKHIIHFLIYYTLYLFPDIMPDPVNLHLDRQIGRVNRSDPFAAKLHVENQVLIPVKRKLTLMRCLDLRVGKCPYSVHMEHKRIRPYVHSVHIEVIDPNTCCCVLPRALLETEIHRIMGMSRLIDQRIVVKVLHDVDLSAMRPRRPVESTCPYRRPGPARTLQSGPDLNPAGTQCLLVSSPDSSRQIFGRIGSAVVIHDAAEDQQTVSQIIAPFIVAHVLECRGSGSPDLAPHRTVKL